MKKRKIFTDNLHQGMEVWCQVIFYLSMKDIYHIPMIIATKLAQFVQIRQVYSHG
jgi:uncharacterized protein YhbP (UPF0306 family)